VIDIKKNRDRDRQWKFMQKENEANPSLRMMRGDGLWNGLAIMDWAQSRYKEKSGD
jgi:hypothetical protein